MGRLRMMMGACLVLACSCSDGQLTGDAGLDGGSIACGADAADGGPDAGDPCGPGGVCADGVCQPTECGDGITDSEAGEDCDDGNAIAFDGCEPGTCRWSCSSDAVCDDGLFCNGTETCSRTTHVCVRQPAPSNGTVCDREAGGTGRCREGACAPADCGDGVRDADESCDDANTAPDDGCEVDCRFTCEVDPGMPNTWRADCDGDGFASMGAEVPTSMECLEPAPSGCGGGWTLVVPVAGAADCNDTSPDQHPGSTETCNGLDDDCNGAIDDGAMRTFYRDADGDGRGNAASPMIACEMPTGHVESSDDCNDACATCFPGAPETCDTLDNNCNTTIDEGVLMTFYRDMDGDGRGLASAAMMACAAPPGHVADSTDCNDACGACYSGATEICDGVDNNCNGSTDEGVMSTFYRDLDTDGFGHPGMPTTACAAPPGYVANNTDCDDSNANVSPGRTEVCGNGVDDNCNGAANELPECTISCNWSGQARWLSHGWDGLAAFGSGAWLSCVGGVISYVEFVNGSGTSVTPPASGTGDLLVGCNWGNANRWAAHGIDGVGTSQHGAQIRCDGTRVTGMSFEMHGGVPTMSPRSGDLGCNFPGSAIWISHGWDGGCAFQVGFRITCSTAGRITNIDYVEGGGCGRYRT